MSSNLKVRASRFHGELEIEGSPEMVLDWWNRLWPEISEAAGLPPAPRQVGQPLPLPSPAGEVREELFGELYSRFPSGLTEVDKVLVAGSFVQGREPDKSFSTKAANQTLLDQNVKVANASECVRRLTATKKVFVVGDGKFRVSTIGFDHLQGLLSSNL